MWKFLLKCFDTFFCKRKITELESSFVAAADFINVVCTPIANRFHFKCSWYFDNNFHKVFATFLRGLFCYGFFYMRFFLLSLNRRRHDVSSFLAFCYQFLVLIIVFIGVGAVAAIEGKKNCWTKSENLAAILCKSLTSTFILNIISKLNLN